jgi:diguanylate cyclase (GGDEF)-like protein
MLRTKRGGDFAFRLGGEEFGILFSLPTYEEAFSYAQSIKEGIEKLHIEHEYSSVAPVITSSMGLIFQTVAQDTTTDELYKLADDNLYAAKESGRNKLIGTIKE